ncbi:tRNA dihydrouridine(20/20a) synthase DusA [Brucella pseudogrignonensis]|uniref:tRNA dihydrouridine(20/20a) synthase DusA n=1 Tax=Brucella pseudogrignonensis TaxID=419475 RepID=UPI0028BA1084|nr:tRNA dihydrouridine(20/20a) synthase DusA [Brucella pseudogrignonensis]MDT6940640.1 tRNA dihydrouridine(20/20a) synthase DusA [Brucella pseudogrignonensis]
MTEMKNKNSNYPDHRFSVAPMLDWSDRHCRYFHRLFSKRALLYTEMVVADAAVHGPRERLMGFDAAEHPIALQLGGSDPVKLQEAARIGAGFGYDEINLNVGCPSDRVQSGTFGACLMQTPDVIARCVAAMKEAVSVPVTVKCRIGVDDQNPEVALDAVADQVLNAGADALWVHARKAWLKGLSPKENRDIPPLDYDRVYRLKKRLPGTFIGINGGISALEEAVAHLDHTDGVMLGRVAYHNPAILADVDHLIYGEDEKHVDMAEIIEAMCEYVDRHIAHGGRLSHISRHMIGLFTGQPGARRWRQMLSTDASKPDASSDLLRQAYASVMEASAEAA